MRCLYIYELLLYSTILLISLLLLSTKIQYFNYEYNILHTSKYSNKVPRIGIGYILCYVLVKNLDFVGIYYAINLIHTTEN